SHHPPSLHVALPILLAETKVLPSPETVDVTKITLHASSTCSDKIKSKLVRTIRTASAALDLLFTSINLRELSEVGISPKNGTFRSEEHTSELQSREK